MLQSDLGGIEEVFLRHADDFAAFWVRCDRVRGVQPDEMGKVAVQVVLSVFLHLPLC